MNIDLISRYQQSTLTFLTLSILMKRRRPRRPIAEFAVIPNTECPAPDPGVELK